MTTALDRAGFLGAVNDAADRLGLSDAERVALAERVAAAAARRARRTRWASPGALAHRIDPLTTTETPALALIDRKLVECADRLEAGQSVRLGVFMPPQEGKSRRITIAFPLWLLVRYPWLRVGIASFEAEIAGEFSAPIRNWIVEYGSGTPTRPTPLDDDLLGITLRGDSTSKTRFNLAGYPGAVIALGMRGGWSGRPVDVLVIDDPYKDAVQADSAAHRRMVEEWVRKVAIPRLPQASLVILVQTRWHPDDLAGYLVRSELALPEHLRTWEFINIPAQAERPPADGDTRYAAAWLPDALGRQPGEYLTSTRGRDPAGWAARRREVGEQAWGSLYQQHPTPPEGAVFQFEHITRNRRPADYDTPAARRAVAVDTSAGGKDEAGIIAGYRGRDSRIYVTHDRSGQMTSAGWARQAWLLVVDTAADDLVWEKNLAGPTMRTELENAWKRIVAQARTLDQAMTRHPGLAGDELIAAAAVMWAAAERRLPEQEVAADPDDVAQLREVYDRLDGPLAQVMDTLPARLIDVQATVGKRLRAGPVAVAYETNKVSHVGVLPELEQELTQWQEGADSPGRLDADVWLVTHLGGARRSRTHTAAGATLPDAAPGRTALGRMIG